MSILPTPSGEVHPVAKLFPMLPGDELAELAADIAERGLLHPVVLDATGRVLDGRNRLAACEQAGVEPVFVTYDGDDTDGYALSVNITRRHLSTGARAIIAAQAGRLNGRGIRETARCSDLNAGRITDATLILDWEPALAEAVVAGTKPLSQAVAEAHFTKREREALQAKSIRSSSTKARRSGASSVRRANVGEIAGNAVDERPPAPPKYGGNRRKHAQQIEALVTALSGAASAFEEVTVLDASVTREEATRLKDDLSEQIQALNRIRTLLKERTK